MMNLETESHRGVVVVAMSSNQTHKNKKNFFYQSQSFKGQIEWIGL